MAYPTNPTTGDTYVLGSKTWTYNGTNWVNQATFASGSSAGVAFSDLTSTPTTLAGYGITDGASESAAVGTVIYHSANTAPTGFIKANGAAISRTTYADLFAAIGTTYGAGDGSSTFNVPDLRGEFMRGWDDARGIDTSRSFGSAQADEFKLHGHPSRRGTEFNVTNDTGGGGILMDSNGGQANRSAFTGTPSNTDGQHIGGSGGSETRPRNIAFLACIKY